MRLLGEVEICEALKITMGTAKPKPSSTPAYADGPTGGERGHFQV